MLQLSLETGKTSGENQMMMNDLVLQLTGQVPRRGRKPQGWSSDKFTVKQARVFLERFIQTLNAMAVGDSLYIPEFGTFKQSPRVARRVVGFDGETTYMLPETVVLTFRETRPMKKRTKRAPKNATKSPPK